MTGWEIVEKVECEGACPPKVHIYCDGACKGNPGPMGWCAILVCGESERVVTGGAPEGTNNLAELEAVACGLRALKARCRVTVHTDSQGVVGWLTGAWRRKKEHIRTACACVEVVVDYVGHQVEYVYEHDSHPRMARADQLARAAVPISETPRGLAENHSL